MEGHWVDRPTRFPSLLLRIRSRIKIERPSNLRQDSSQVSVPKTTSALFEPPPVIQSVSPSALPVTSSTGDLSGEVKVSSDSVV